MELRDGGVLTVVVVTSPAPCHPSTEMIERLLLSLRLLHGLEATGGGDGASGGGGSSDDAAAVSVLISCDGYEVGSKKKRSAAVSEERAADYEEYKARLLRTYGAVCTACGCGCTCGQRPRPSSKLDVQVSELGSWHGFGLGLRAALALVRTPLVLVSPHDMEFGHAADLRHIVALVGDASNGVEYVGFPNANTLTHPQRMQARGVRIAPVLIDGCRLLPLCQWKENPHVCRHAHAVHTLCTRHAYAIHDVPCTRTMHACHARMPCASQWSLRACAAWRTTSGASSARPHGPRLKRASSSRTPSASGSASSSLSKGSRHTASGAPFYCGHTPRVPSRTTPPGRS